MDIMKSKKKRISITLDPEVVQKISKLAEEDDRSLSQFVNIILKEYLVRQEKSEL